MSMSVQSIVHWAENEMVYKNTGWMTCDERYSFEDYDVELFLFKITNEHITAALLPILLS